MVNPTEFCALTYLRPVRTSGFDAQINLTDISNISYSPIRV